MLFFTFMIKYSLWVVLKYIHVFPFKEMAAADEVPLLKRYKASMVLSGAGDALGYKNGNWEFCRSGTTIHEELKKLGGLGKIKVKCRCHT